MTVNFNFIEIPDPKNTDSGFKMQSYFYLLIPILLLFVVIVVVLVTFGRKKWNAHVAGRSNGIAQSEEWIAETTRASTQKYELVGAREGPRRTAMRLTDDEYNSSSFSSGD
jgi:hypothetical protein